MSNLVPVAKGALVKYKQPTFKLVDTTTVFATREEVKRHLPDICGHVLAKAWHDKEYEKLLIDDIDKTFRDGGVVLPSEFRLVYDKPSGQRAKISIYEQHEANKNFKIKVCSLTLNMLAQR